MVNLILLVVLSPYTTVLLGLCTTYNLYKSKEEINWNAWNTGLLSLFIWSFIVGLINKSIMSMIVSFLFLFYFSMDVYIENNWSSEKYIYKIAHNLLKLSIFSGILGIIEKFSFENYNMILWRRILGLPSNTSSAHRIFSTFGNPNIAGDWFAIMIIIALFYEGRTFYKRDKIFYYFCVVLFLINLFLTGSRGAFVAMACGLFVLFMFKCSKHNRIIFLCIVIIVSIVGFMPGKVPNISKDIVGHNIDRSVSLREEIWRGSINMYCKKPITGWGMLGTVEEGNNFIRYNGIVHHAHNIWIAFLTSLGLVGFLIYIFMRIKLYKSTLKIISTDSSSCIQLLIAIQAVIICHGIVDFTIIAPQIGVLFIGSGGMIFSLAKEMVVVKNNNKSLVYMDLENEI